MRLTPHLPTIVIVLLLVLAWFLFKARLAVPPGTNFSLSGQPAATLGPVANTARYNDVADPQ